ncbi:hypothetical protein [Pedobacter nyackensis]|uniref:hypothetical protein n=1 Tax=Pedobacter nyackensis TaxID=475255 RepID=UPI00292EC9F8|nr:hypothetical protein [Pedobacter nyackensis]
MKPSRNDPFDLSLSMRGLGAVVTRMHSDIYEYVYHFTFKKYLKSYIRDFKDPWEQPIEHDDFFNEVDDPVVKSCFAAMRRLVDYKIELNLIFGIDEIADLEDEYIVVESKRFKLYLLVYKRSKSYKKLKLYYERTLTGFIETLSMYAYALTAQSYKIPLVLKRQLALPGEESLRLLNDDDSNVAMIKELVIGLKKDLEDFKSLSVSKTAKKTRK